MIDKEVEQFTTRSLLNLDDQIKFCSNSSERFVLFAKKAGNLARLSNLADARDLVSELRHINREYEPRLSAWIIFAEGLIQHFSDLDNAKAKDKFHRAFLVSQLANDRELAGVSAAWMAHCELVAGKMSDAATHIKKAFEWSDPDCGEARGRASMVLADALNWAGDINAARHWYKQARIHAVRDGDIAMQNVMLFNGAAFGVSHLTLKDCLAPLDSNEWKRVSMEAASATNLNSALGIESLQTLVPMMQAELLIVQRKWQEALAILDANISEYLLEGQKRLLPKMLAQRAWCKANQGNFEQAMRDAQEAINSVDDCADLDDLAVLHFRISGVGRLATDAVIEVRHRMIAMDYMNMFRRQQAEILELLRPILESLTTETKNPAGAGS